MNKKHTFVICAYGKSPFLEECILSVKGSCNESYILMTTSTDSDYIREVCKKYDIPIFINTGESSITRDWNFALSKVETRYATIAHQDDIYAKNFAKIVVDKMEESKHPLIAFTDYFEIKNGSKVINSTMLKIKRAMLLPMMIPGSKSSVFIRRRCLSIGDPICCPSVTFCMDNIPSPLFKHHYRSAEDWEVWEMLSALKGDFIYIPKMLVGHRIHEDSETSKIIADGARIEENLEMYSKFWPSPIAKGINRLYTKAEGLNK